MNEEKQNFLKNNLFLFDSYRCEYIKNIQESSFGGRQTIQVCLTTNTDVPLKFAFASNGKGLVLVGERGKLIADNLLGRLISIKHGDSDALLSYFENNGFFFPINENDSETIEVDTLFEVVKRLKATVELLNQVGELNPERKNYTKMLSLVMYLMFAPQLHLPEHDYFSAKHTFVEELDSTDQSQDLEREQEIFDTGAFVVPDTIYDKFSFDSDTYQSIANGLGNTPGYDNPEFKRIVHYFANEPYATEKHRKIVDFLFHYQMEVGIIRNFNTYGALDYYETPLVDNFSADLKKALIDVAKIVIGDEINANICHVHPAYDVRSMSPKWKVDSLMSALYFSIFYMNPEQELYRQCENPRCGNYFYVRSTATNKKYCSPACSNAMQQAKMRRRKKEQALQ